MCEYLTTYHTFYPDFIFAEKLILQAGCKFVTGQVESASGLLERCLQKVEKRNAQVKEKEMLGTERSGFTSELQRQSSSISHEGSKMLEPPANQLSAVSAIRRGPSMDPSESSAVSVKTEDAPEENEALMTALVRRRIFSWPPDLTHLSLYCL